MTKKDGDRLRAIVTELEHMAADYGVTNNKTGTDLRLVTLAIKATVRGARFRVTVLS